MNEWATNPVVKVTDFSVTLLKTDVQKKRFPFVHAEFISCRRILRQKQVFDVSIYIFAVNKIICLWQPRTFD